MKQESRAVRSAATERYVAKPLGKVKATNFAAMEGKSLNKQSVRIIAQLEQRGLKGDALRAAIKGVFVARRDP